MVKPARLENIVVGFRETRIFHERGCSRSLRNHLVLDAVRVHPVRRDEHLQEMGIQFLGRARTEPAKARQLGVAFQVDLPVGARVALRRERPEKVIHYRLVTSISLGESARAPLSGHTIAFLLVIDYGMQRRVREIRRSGALSAVPATPA